MEMTCGRRSKSKDVRHSVRRSTPPRQKDGGPLHQASGIMMVELLIAMLVLAIGMAGITTLLIMAMQSNNRNMRDTTSTLLSQSVMEQLAWAVSNDSDSALMSDCLGNNFTLNPAGGPGPSGAGAAVDPASGSVDFSTPPNPDTGYRIRYTVCGVEGQTYTYDVRWNVRNLESSGTKTYTRLVTVAARADIATTNEGNQIKLYGLPITLRSVVAKAAN